MNAPERPDDIDKKESGRVVLVGAGCGAGLITLAGLECIRKAEVLLYDALISDELLSYANPLCEKIYVGKRKDMHSMPQAKINSLLLEHARQGKLVVRLKGGDSFVFGRGAEEVIFLQERGIRCSVIPGVSSAIAVPEVLGIPVTHRGTASSFTVVTAHGGEDGASNTDEDYRNLSALTGTLVFMMVGSRFRLTAKQLLDNGKPKDTPAAVLSQGFSSEEKRIDGTLEFFSAYEGEIRTPAIFVVGKVAALNLFQDLESKQSTNILSSDIVVEANSSTDGSNEGSIDSTNTIGIDCSSDKVVEANSSIASSIISNIVTNTDSSKDNSNEGSIDSTNLGSIYCSTNDRCDDSENGGSNGRCDDNSNDGSIVGSNIDSNNNSGIANRDMHPDETVLVTGTASFINRMEAVFLSHGIQVAKCETLRIRPIFETIPDSFSEYQWLAFTSANGVDIFFSWMKKEGRDYRSLMHLRFACIGRGTAKRLASHGFIADAVPAVYTVEEFAKHLERIISPGEKILFLRAKNGSPILSEYLSSRGCLSEERFIYETLTSKMDHPRADYVVLGSGSGVWAWFSVADIPKNIKYICIGQETEKVLRSYGAEPFLTADEHSAEGIVKAYLRKKLDE